MFIQAGHIMIKLVYHATFTQPMIGIQSDSDLIEHVPTCRECGSGGTRRPEGGNTQEGDRHWILR